MRNLKDILWLLLREKRNKDKRSVWDGGDFYKLNKGRVMHVLMEAMSQNQYSISPRVLLFQLLTLFIVTNKKVICSAANRTVLHQAKPPGLYISRQVF